MKLHTKLCVVLTILLLVTQGVNSLIYYRYEEAQFIETATENLSAMGEKIIQQYEEYVRVMDYTLENFLSNGEFMSAMATLAQSGASRTDVLAAQSVIMSVLYREPLNQNFYRVNLFNRDGVFYTSRLDNRDTADSNSSDLSAIVAGIPWLDQADAAPFERLLVAPYADPWTVGRTETVFSAARSVLWLGHHVGYLEVQASVEALDMIFSAGTLSDVRVLALMSDGQALYMDADSILPDTAVIDDENPARENRLDTKDDVFQMRFQSDESRLTLYLLQDTAQWQASMQGLLAQIAGISTLILLAAVGAAVLLSFGLTRSVRRLERRIDAASFQGEGFALQAPRADLSGGGDEVRRLERAFDALVYRLNMAVRDELAAQELRLQAHFSALQAQINPHFIYNTLNMIASKSVELGSAELAGLSVRFADMLRYSTDMSTKTASLAQELAHAKNYLELLKARYGERLHYQLDEPADIADMLLPRVSLQPLVENCAIHGYRHTTGTMRIRVQCRQMSEGTRIRVCDNGDGFPQAVMDGVAEAVQRFQQGEYGASSPDGAIRRIGLLNTLSRMMFLCKGRMDAHLYNDGGAVVELLFFSMSDQEEV